MPNPIKDFGNVKKKKKKKNKSVKRRTEKKKKKNPQVSKEGLTSKTFEQFVCYEQQLRHSRIIFMKAG